MQTILYVLAKSSRQQSLREAVIAKITKGHCDKEWEVLSQQTKGRSKGWAKIRRVDAYGVLNLEWDADAKTLIGRVVSRNSDRAAKLVGAFVTHLLYWHGNKISAITLRTI